MYSDHTRNFHIKNDKFRCSFEILSDKRGNHMSAVCMCSQVLAINQPNILNECVYELSYARERTERNGTNEPIVDIYPCIARTNMKIIISIQ